MKKLLKYLKPYIGLTILAPLLMVGEVVADLILPYFMSFIVNFGIIGMNIHEQGKDGEIAFRIVSFFLGKDYTRMELIVCFGILMLIITLLGGGFGTACAYASSTAAQGFGNALRLDTYQRVMSLSIQQTDLFKAGSLVTRLTNDISLTVEFMEMLMRQFVRAFTFVIGGTIMLVRLDLKFGMVLFCSVPVLILVLLIVLKKSVPLYAVVQKKLDGVNTVIQENVSGARVVKAYTQEEYECNRFDYVNKSLKDVNYQVLKKIAVVSPVLIILLNVAVAAIIYIGGFNIYIEKAGMDTGSIMAAITYITQVVNSVMMVTNLFQSIFRANTSAKRINEVLDSKPIILGGEETKGKSETAILFNDVSFYYPGTTGRPVLSHINLEIKKGETLAVIGMTGSGKTSLLSLIVRFYDASEGEIYIYDRRIDEYSLKAVRQKIGYVMQKSELFSGTIKTNIKWGKEDATELEISEAAQAAQALDFINNQQQGFETIVEEKGVSLSGGQKQRVSIARALIRNPEILLLDDATSALDLTTEAKLRNALKLQKGKMTIVMVAQRIASVMDADRIAVLENDGTIKHCAPHNELLQNSETYREIYNSQMKSGSFIPKEGDL